MSDPAGTDSDLGDKVTISYRASEDGELVTWEEGSVNDATGRNVLSSGSTGQLVVECADGYYIHYIVLACEHGTGGSDGADNPFKCNTAASDDLMGLVLPGSSLSYKVLNISDIYDLACHTSSVPDYYLMIMIEPVPADVYVGYNTGSAGGNDLNNLAAPVEDADLENTIIVDEVTRVGSYYTLEYTARDLEGSPYTPSHTALEVSDAAIAEAYDMGYEFAGWKVEWYQSYESNNNHFTTEIDEGSTSAGNEVSLYTHVLLTAQWVEISTTDVTVTKVWDDADNQDGNRPESVNVQLYADGSAQGTAITLNASNDWTYTWTDLAYKNNIGSAIDYTVRETTVTDGYSSAVTGDAATGFIVTNSYTPETTAFTVNKVWNHTWTDSEGNLITNPEENRPTEITLYLYANGTYKDTVTVKPDADGNWTYTWTDIPKYANGALIQYVAYEAAILDKDGVEIYEPSWEFDGATNTETITNSYTPETTSMEVQKVWEDDDNRDGLRPTDIQVQLQNRIQNSNDSWAAVSDVYRDDVTVTLNTGNDWAYKWSGLPIKNSDGDALEYQVVELSAVAGYEAEYTYADHNALVITNTHETATTEVSVEKIWDDGNNQDGKRPDSINIQLLANGTVQETVNLNDTYGWIHNWTNLPKYYDGGKVIFYTIQEETIPAEYIVSVTGNAATGYMVTNTYVPEEITFEVTKVWDDKDNQDGKRPDSIQIQLYADDTACGEAITLDASNNWHHKWTGLDKYEGGEVIHYTVVEPVVAEGYSVSAQTSTDIDGNTVVTLTNTYNPETTYFRVEKIWDDAHDQDGIRPSYVVITLYETYTPNGASDSVSDTVESVTLNEANNWYHEFSDLPVYAEGEEGAVITYNVAERYVANYTASYVNVSANYTQVINSRTPDTTEVSVSKVWDDTNNQDGKRPAEITVQLLADNVVIDTVTLNEANGWTYTWKDDPTTADVNEALPVYAAGKAISYTINEVIDTETAKYYTTAVTGTAAEGFTITNTHEVEKTSVSVEKVWDDEDNQDGKRTASVNIQLLADGIVKDIQTLSEGNNWAYTWTDLDVYADGKEIVYTVSEEIVPEGYTVKVAGDAEAGFTVTNTHTPEVITIKANKVWDDKNNQDGKRPTAITLHLTTDGAHDASRARVLEAANDWKTEWTNLPKYANGEEIEYLVREEVLVDSKNESLGYVTTYNRVVKGNTVEVTVTNTYTPGKTSVSVEKIWDDAHNQDGLRPASIEVELYADEQPTGKVVTLPDANGIWTYVWTDLDLMSGGNLIKYTVVEKTKLVDYTSEVILDSVIGNEYLITNTHTPATTNVKVTKVWDDADNQDGIRPASVDVHLLADGIAKETVTLNEANNWTYEWTALAKYAGGKEIEYTVIEPTVPEGYTAAVTGSATAGFTVTNSHIPATTSVSVEKVWDDADNQDGKRSASVDVTLQKSMDAGVTWTEVNTVTLNEANSWAYEWTDLAVYAIAGKEIIYMVTEPGVPEGYSADITGSAAAGFTVTNSYIPATTTVSVEKVWDDADNQDGIRPIYIVFDLMADGIRTDRKVLREADGWGYTWTNLPKYSDGTEIKYTIEERPIGGYTAEITGDAASGFTVTNTHDPDTTEISVTKVWDDNDNQDGKRPASIAVELLADGQAVTGKTAILNEANSWTYTWTELDVHKAGVDVVYTVNEVLDTETAKHYTTAINGTAVEGFTITNTHESEKNKVSVIKVWDDVDNQDGERPTSVEVQLLANGAVKETVTLNAANSWAHTWSNLDVFANGKVIEYTVKEVTNTLPKGYSAEITGSAANGFTITNKYTPETVKITVNKIWDDNDNADKLRPETVTVHLLANNEHTGVTKELNAENGWSTEWTNLPKYADGKEIDYTVLEELIAAQSAANLYEMTGYVEKIGTADVNHHVISITNTYMPETTSLTVTKVWHDANNQDGIRPVSVDVTLQMSTDDGATWKSLNTITLSASNKWMYTWTSLLVLDRGVEVDYRAIEASVPAGYTATEEQDAYIANNYTITNTHIPATTEVGVSKVWNDADNQDGKRPSEITVQLLADNAVIDTVTLNESNNWAYTWKDDVATADVNEALPVYAAGKAIRYTVKEINVPSEYTAVVTGNAQTGYVITNSYTPATTEVSVSKVWNDADNQDGKRPGYIEVELTADGAVVENATVYLHEENNWTFTWEALPVYAAGKIIDYSVNEVTSNLPTGYTSVIEGTPAEGFNITNSYGVEKVSFTANKVWDDADNQDGKRPVYVLVELFADNESAGTAAVLRETNNWTYTWNNLDKYNAGKEIVYTVKERAVSEYTTDIAVEGNVATVTNSYVPETTQISVKKVWNDADNQDGKRPASVIVELWADGNATGNTVTLNDNNNWAYTWTGLAKNAAGKAIAYTVEEVDVPAGYTRVISGSAAAGYTITNNYTTEKITITANKVWDDNNDNDGKRPDSVTLHLIAGNAHTGETRVLNSENNWTTEWNNLDRYADGSEIVYSVYEEKLHAEDGRAYSTTYDRIVDADGNVAVTVTNKRMEDSVISVTVEKLWDDADNQDNVRPESIEVVLTGYTGYGTATQTVVGTYKAVIRENNGLWRYTFTELPEYKASEQIKYFIEENVPAGYLNDDVYPIINKEPELFLFEITNKHITNTTEISVEKVWDDADNQDGIRPDSIDVQLLANGNIKDTITLNAANNWNYTWTGLDENKAGTTISYTVKEVVDAKTAEEYKNVITGSMAEGFVITNTHDVEKTSIDVIKVWNDADNQDGKRPASVEVQLYANGKAYGTVVTLSETNNWKHTWTDLDVYAAGKEIVYTLEETMDAEATAEYTAIVSGTVADGFVIMNTHDVAKTEVTVIKAWDDKENQDGYRPNEITVGLLADGAKYGVPVVLSEANNWTYTWTDLDVNAAGQVADAIEYTVQEIDDFNVSKYYTAEITGDMTVGFTITNTHVTETVQVNVLKVWDDKDDQDGYRPDEVTVELLANGSVVDVVTLDETNGWAKEWTGLDKKAAGTDIVYTVREVLDTATAAQYTASVDGNMENGFVITNSHETEKRK